MAWGPPATAVRCYLSRGEGRLGQIHGNVRNDSGAAFGQLLLVLCWSASISVSQAPVCISLVPADLQECGPFTGHGFPLCPCSWSQPPFLPFCPRPSLTRKTLMGCSLPWPVPPTQLCSSPPPPRHLLAGGGMTASSFLQEFRDLCPAHRRHY